MGWSLDDQPPREPKLPEAFFLAVGKALDRAGSFERKGRYVLRIGRIVDHIKAGGDVFSTLALKPKEKKRLHATFQVLKGCSDINAQDIAFLKRAKDARIEIAHECMDLALISGIRTKVIAERLERLREEVDFWAAGHNVVSRWVFEIEEQELAASGIQSTDAHRMED